jgi:transcriptional regulator with XRE-family HTH domain
MPVDARKVGKRIQEVRKQRGLTQSELSQMVDLSTKYISNIECGFKTPKLNTFVAIANALQCDANLLLSDVLDVATGQESGLISKKLLSLPVDEQRRILRVIDVMIDESAGK